jgi:hypothetical protein
MLIDLTNIYNTYFQPKYSITTAMQGTPLPVFNTVPTKVDNSVAVLGTSISKKNAMGIEIFLPITLKVNDSLQLTIDCCTIRVTGKKTIIRTPVSEQKGSVKEQFNIEDYEFAVKGVLIGTNQKFPDDQVIMLKNIFESTLPVKIENALADLFLDASNQIVISDLEFPEIEGKTLRHKPFTLSCESDFITTLTLK